MMSFKEWKHSIFNAIALVGWGFLKAGGIVGSVSLITYLIWDSKSLSYLLFAALTLLTVIIAGSSENWLFDSKKILRKTEFFAGITYLILLFLIINNWASIYGFGLVVWIIVLGLTSLIIIASPQIYQRIGVSTGMGMTQALALVLIDISLVGIVISLKNILILLIQG